MTWGRHLDENGYRDEARRKTLYGVCLRSWDEGAVKIIAGRYLGD